MCWGDDERFGPGARPMAVLGFAPPHEEVKLLAEVPGLQAPGPGSWVEPVQDLAAAAGDCGERRGQQHGGERPGLQDAHQPQGANH